MKWFKRYRARVVGQVEVLHLQWSLDRGTQFQGNVKAGALEAGKTYLLIEDVDAAVKGEKNAHVHDWKNDQHEYGGATCRECGQRDENPGGRR